MDGMDRIFCVIVLALLLSLLAIAITAIVAGAHVECRYIENGYTRAMLVGYDEPQWVKGEQK